MTVKSLIGTGLWRTRPKPNGVALGDLPWAEQVELDSAGDAGDAGLAGLAGGEVAGFLGFPRAGPVRAVAGEEAGHEDLQQAPQGITILPGGVLSVPPGAIVTVSPSMPEAAQPILAIPGASDIAVFADQIVTVSPWAVLAAKDAAQHPGAAAAAQKPSYVVGPARRVRPLGGAKISFAGRASLTLPAGTVVAAPGADLQSPARTSSLKRTTVFALPHTSQVVASRMWSLLAASFLTLFGTGAEIGILGVLVYALSAASFTVRLLCAVALAVAAVVVWLYSVVSIRALADPKPGDALNATGGTSFML